MIAVYMLLIMFGLFLIGMPIAYAIGIAAVVSMFFFSSIDVSMFATSAITGIDSFPLMAIPFFVLAGKLMEEGGISERLVALANLIVGKIAGGLAIIATISCTIFGAISGSAVATTVAIGGIMLPGMDKANYPRPFSAAVLCISGIIGALIPPSLTFVIYGAVTGTSISDLFIAGIIPGVMLTVVLSVTAYVVSKKNGYQGKPADRSMGNVWLTLKRSTLALLVPVIIMGGIYSGIFTPTEAGCVACLYAAIVALFVYKTLSFKDIYRLTAQSARLTIVMMVVIAFASGFARFMAIEDVPQIISNFLIAVSNDKIIFLLIINIFLLLLGAIMDTTAACIVLAPIFMPIAVNNYGIDPIQFGMIMCFNLLLGLTTPPVGSSIFVTSSFTKIPLQTIGKALIPFWVGALICLLLITYVPWFSTVLVK
ncbi:MAG: C4-dicarboxylate ABC transporter permease [Deltaproteobacteria bacterium HGW-Deltaproteobacteria-12]|jgi:C4-dicarboxylate transporter DctM subunit|nr:MAG: C4-dicarboxylate ABC transporter permease [Deltaproteobacteria bacterium HGW-Deltaproteobacteria-12]